MKIAKFAQAATDNMEYTLDYSQWLTAGEQISSVVFSVSPTTSPVLAMSSAVINSAKTAFTFFASGGVTGDAYDVAVTVTTSIGQVKQDHVSFTIRDGIVSQNVFAEVTPQVRSVLCPVPDNKVSVR